jgi:drug/metabolite transporter (DMT)-like permease
LRIDLLMQRSTNQVRKGENAMTVQRYFDLGAPRVLLATASGPSFRPSPAPVLTAGTGNGSAIDQDRLPFTWQLIVYGIFLLAVVSSRFLDFYTSAIPGNPFVIDWKYLVFAAIISLAAFPVVYEKAIGSRNSPYMVQVALVFTTGLGWEKMLSTVTHLANG